MVLAVRMLSKEGQRRLEKVPIEGMTFDLTPPPLRRGLGGGSVGNGFLRGNLTAFLLKRGRFREG